MSCIVFPTQYGLILTSYFAISWFEGGKNMVYSGFGDSEPAWKKMHVPSTRDPPSPVALDQHSLGSGNWFVSIHEFPWRRSNQSILKEISPEYSLEGLMLKLKLQYFGHLMQRTGSLEKSVMLGKIEGRRRRGRQRMRWLDGMWWTWVWVASRSWWWTGRPGMLQSMGSQLSDWTELNP